LSYKECIESTNPVQVAAAIMARTREVTPGRKKFEVYRRLVRLGLEHQEIHLLLSYVDRYSRLKGEQLEEFESFVAKDKKEVGMIMTSFEEKALKKGIEKGIERGREEGIGEGLEKGIVQGLEKAAERMIASDMNSSDIRKITGLSLRRIDELRKKLKR